MPSPDFEESLRAKLDPAEVRINLARAGLVLATYELVKSEVIQGVRGFFVYLNRGHDNYQRHVLSLAPKSVFKASCAWLREMGALRDGDYETLEALQRHRYAVAHELPTYVGDPNTEVDIDLVRAVAEILRRLGQFWGRIEVDINEDFDGMEIADEDIRSGVSIFVDFLLDVTVSSHDRVSNA